MREVTEAERVLSKIYYDELFERGTDIQAQASVQESMRVGFVEAVTEGMRVGRFNVDDIIGFVANLRIGDAIQTGYAKNEWARRAD